jgi:uncharacterized protein YciI
MRHFLVEITYLAPLPAIDAAVAAHREFLQKGYDRGLLLMSGPMTPRTGGVVIARGESVEVIETFFRDDPFKVQGLARYRIVEFTPVKHQLQIADWCLPKT